VAGRFVYNNIRKFADAGPTNQTCQAYNSNGEADCSSGNFFSNPDSQLQFLALGAAPPVLGIGLGAGAAELIPGVGTIGTGSGYAAFDFGAIESADTGADIALGSRYGLRPFAYDIGADHLLDIPEEEWKSVFMSHVEDFSTTFHVNMNGFYGNSTEEMIVNEIQSGLNTGWELRQLLKAGRLPGVKFYLNGAGTLVPNPF
jgi:hypothetical protein